MASPGPPGADPGADPGAHLFDKTRLCKYFARGRCCHGRACHFAHGAEELRRTPDLYLTRLCSTMMRFGFCREGPACRYAHDVRELRPPATPGDSMSPEQLSAVVRTMFAHMQALQAGLSRMGYRGPNAECVDQREDREVAFNSEGTHRPQLPDVKSTGAIAAGLALEQQQHQPAPLRQFEAPAERCWLADVVRPTTAAASAPISACSSTGAACSERAGRLVAAGPAGDSAGGVAAPSDRGAQRALPAPGSEPSEALECRLVVNRTFYTMVPSETVSPRRRAESAPPRFC